jgi:hypothetical protein
LPLHSLQVNPLAVVRLKLPLFIPGFQGEDRGHTFETHQSLVVLVVNVEPDIHHLVKGTEAVVFGRASQREFLQAGANQIREGDVLFDSKLFDLFSKVNFKFECQDFFFKSFLLCN